MLESLRRKVEPNCLDCLRGIFIRTQVPKFATCHPHQVLQSLDPFRLPSSSNATRYKKGNQDGDSPCHGDRSIDPCLADASLLTPDRSDRARLSPFILPHKLLSPDCFIQVPVSMRIVEQALFLGEKREAQCHHRLTQIPNTLRTKPLDEGQVLKSLNTQKGKKD